MIRCGVVCPAVASFLRALRTTKWRQGEEEQESKRKGHIYNKYSRKRKEKEQSRKGGKQRVEEKSKRRRCVLIRDKEKEKKIGELDGDMRKQGLMRKKKQDLGRSLWQPFGFGERTRHP